MPPPDAPRLTPRARARQATLTEIKDVARAQLADVGSAGLSLRAIARELGLVSSALYRYFPSRDELLTELIVEAYDDLGATTEAAEAQVDRADIEGRWMATTLAVRRWALAHPSQYALLYGSPVPGYHAPPERTVAPATRVQLVMLRLLTDAWNVGRLVDPPFAVPLPEPLRADFQRLTALLDSPVPPNALARGFAAWMQVFGAVSFEVFGQLHNVITEHDELFAFSMRQMAAMVGIADVPAGAPLDVPVSGLVGEDLPQHRHTQENTP